MAPQISTRWSLKRSEVVFMKTPFVTKDQLEAIAAQYPTPFHIYDEQGIRENARRLRAAFAWNPGYREYFAVRPPLRPPF